MFPYVLAILLVATYSNSLPTSSKANGSLAPLFTSLSKECKNPFLSNQITDKKLECNVSAQHYPYNEKQFECLIFYDINSRLCKAVSESNKLDLKVDFTTAIAEEINVEQLCTNSKNWSFGSIQDFPNYQKAVSAVFTSTSNIACVKVCGVEDVTSQDANFFCKYYKWGFQVLNKLSTTTKSPEATSNAAVDTDVNVDSHTTISGDGPGHTSKVVNEDRTPAVNTDQSAHLQGNINKGTAMNEITSGDNVGSKAPDRKNPKSSQSPSSTKPMEDVNNGDLKIPTPDLASNNNKEGETNPEGMPRPPSSQGAGVGENNNDNENQNHSAHNSNQDNDNEYQEPDETEVNNDNNDGNDPMSEHDPRNGMSQHNRIETPLAGEKFYTNPQEYSDDDDHFFPFFLTAVIMVVLIYVLYHNKSKVTKVVLGLIVEGRQPGRRRNSRGHAYRRLDTLEQAMSTNSTAPPSKIIY